jgi:hypothetical protein
MPDTIPEHMAIWAENFTGVVISRSGASSDRSGAAQQSVDLGNGSDGSPQGAAAGDASGGTTQASTSGQDASGQDASGQDTSGQGGSGQDGSGSGQDASGGPDGSGGAQQDPGNELTNDQDESDGTQSSGDEEEYGDDTDGQNGDDTAGDDGINGPETLGSGPFTSVTPCAGCAGSDTGSARESGFIGIGSGTRYGAYSVQNDAVCVQFLNNTPLTFRANAWISTIGADKPLCGQDTWISLPPATDEGPSIAGIQFQCLGNNDDGTPRKDCYVHMIVSNDTDERLVTITWSVFY